MAVAGGPNLTEDGLLFYYDTDNGKSYKGEPTDNILRLFTHSYTLSKPNNLYRVTTTESNVDDDTAPSGQYSRYTGIDSSDNNQIFYNFTSNGLNYTGETLTYSVELKGSGTCHLTVYDNQWSYRTSSTITLTNEWTRYSFTADINASAGSHWCGVRGITNSTDVYVAASQGELKGHATPFTATTRSATESLYDFIGDGAIDVSNVSFDSNADITFDGTDDIISTGLLSGRNPSTDPFTVEAWVKSDTTSGPRVWIDATSNGSGQRFYSALIDSTTSATGIQGAGWGDSTPGHTNWSHQVIVMDGSNANCYADGVLKYQIGYTSYGMQALNIGGRASYRWLGDISMFKIYNKALTAEEVENNFNGIRSRFGI